MDKFSTGSQRDTQEGKPRFELIPVEFLTALAELYAWGAEHYGDDNWRLGQPKQRVEASMLRHVYSVIRGDDDEDHYTRAVFNLIFLWMMKHGYVPDATITVEFNGSVLNLEGVRVGTVRTPDPSDIETELHEQVWDVADDFTDMYGGADFYRIANKFPNHTIGQVNEAIKRLEYEKRLELQDGKYVTL